jgi:hypothetical protein
LSSTDISPKSRMFWKVRAIPRRVMRPQRSPAIDAPSNSTSPEVGVYTPVMTLKTVVLPAPLGPIRP